MLKPSNHPAVNREDRASLEWALIAGLIVVAAALRFWRIGVESLWLDEAASWSFARLPVAELLTRNADPGNPPLYYLALGQWLALFGDSEIALRSFSAVAGVLSVPVIYLLGRELFGRRAGALAALLLAFSPIHLFYSQEARQYTPAMFLGLVSAWLFMRAVKTDRWAHWLGAAFFAALAFYIHYSAMLIPAFQGAYALVAARRWRAVGAAALFGLLCLPGVVLYLAPTFLLRDGYQFWQGHVTPGALARMGNKLFGKPTSASDPPEIQAACALLLGIAAVYPLWLAGRSAKREDTDGGRPLLFSLLYLLVPMVLFIGLALMKPVWQERYLLVALPGYLLVLAWVLTRQQGARRVLLATILVLLHAGGMKAATREWQKEEWREAVRMMQTAARSARNPDTEVFLTMPFLHLPFDYYSRGNPPRTGYPRGRAPLTPADTAELDALARRAAQRGTIFVIHGVAGDGDPDLLLVRRLAAIKGTGTFRRFVGMRVFAFGEGAPALGGIPVTPSSLAAGDDRYR
ncbi:MAG TPA: glycosyltransferase family 39 protein [Armatimonadota bacterium]|nr:glycosyltransferase family 39 protein [Armatimonadota bacterium]HOM82089.1 glycosyltransferase family 39 protein [Armatimonadota bacterium]